MDTGLSGEKLRYLHNDIKKTLVRCIECIYVYDVKAVIGRQIKACRLGGRLVSEIFETSMYSLTSRRTRCTMRKVLFRRTRCAMY